MTFQSYRRPLAMVTLFKHLGRVLMVVDEKWMVVVENLRKAQKSWA